MGHSDQHQWTHDLEEALGVTLEEAERAGITLQHFHRFFTEEAERLSQRIEDDALSLADRARCARRAIKALDLAEVCNLARLHREQERQQLNSLWNWET